MVWIIIQAIVIIAAACLVVELLIVFKPLQLRRLAQANLRRPDGTLSHRRMTAEAKANNRLRRDLWAVLFLVSSGFGAAILMIHFFVVPLDIGIQSVQKFSLNGAEFKSNLKSVNMDRKLEKRLGATYGLAPRESAKVARMLWQSWPILIAAFSLLVLASGALLRWGYMRALKDYASDLVARKEQYELRDLSRAHTI